MSLPFPKSGISELCSIKSQSLFPLAAVFHSLDLSNFQESWANGAPGRAKGKQLLLSPHLLLLPTSEFEPCISISQAPKLSFRSQRYFFIYFKGLWCTLLDGCLDLLFNELPRICRVSQLKASQLIQRECRCSQRTNFPFYRFLSFPHCRGEGNISQFFHYGKQ